MNSKKSNHEPAADPVLARHGAYAQALSATGNSIPALLCEERDLRAQLGEAEISGGDLRQLRERLDTIGSARESAARQRATACAGLLAMGDELRAARAAAAEDLAAITQGVVGDFQMRWSRACAQLGALHTEAAILSRVLRSQVLAAPPYVAALSADGQRMNVVFAGHAEAGAVTLAPEVASVIERLDALDSAGALVVAIAQAREWDQRFIASQRSGNMPVTGGLYQVVRPFEHLGTRFEVGMLVSSDLMGAGVLRRRWQGRELLPLEGAAMAAA